MEGRCYIDTGDGWTEVPGVVSWEFAAAIEARQGLHGDFAT